MKGYVVLFMLVFTSLLLNACSPKVNYEEISDNALQSFNDGLLDSENGLKSEKINNVKIYHNKDTDLYVVAITAYKDVNPSFYLRQDKKGGKEYTSIDKYEAENLLKDYEKVYEHEGE